MPYKKILLQPGFNTQETQLLNQGGWSLGNLVKFRLGLIEKLPGWAQLFSQACAGIVRALHAYEDLYQEILLLIGSDGGAQVYSNGVLVTQTLYQNIGTSVLFSVKIATLNVTVSNVPFTVSVGDIFQFPQDVSIGGTIFRQGSTVTAVAPIIAGSFDFNLPVNAIATVINLNGVATFTWGAFTNEARVKVTFYTHGLSAGNTYTPQLKTAILAKSGGKTYDLSIQAGTAYQITSVLDADNFVIDVPAFLGFPIISAVHTEGSVVNGINNVGGGQIAIVADVPVNANNWSLDNMGQNGLFCQDGGPIYQFTPPLASSPGLFNLGASTPQINTGMFVAVPQAQVIAYGSEATIGGGMQDPLLIRWSDVGNQDNFIAAVTNQAGSFHLSRGSKCVGGIHGAQSELIWTDVGLWTMTYVGVGFNDSIYAFNEVGKGCGLLAQNACCSLGASTWWLSQQGVWIYNANGVQPIECPVWDEIWPRIDQSLVRKITAGADSGTQEVWFFYPSLSSPNGENDSYVKYNAIENIWDFGMLDGTAWSDQSGFGGPLRADTSLLVQQHDIGFDANGQPMSGAFAETGFFTIGDGDQFTFFDLVLPDFKWLGNDGYVQMTFWAQNESGETPTMYGPFPTSPTMKIISTGGIRARQIAMRVDWGLTKGFNARLGVVRARMAPAGRV